VSSFDPARTPPAGSLPRIVLGPPGAAPSAGGEGVFVPVATPGLNAPGHLFRADTVIVVPLEAVRDDGLPGVDDVLRASRTGWVPRMKSFLCASGPLW
jgi:formylmethanofuran dehydrogenase subunit B